MSETYEIGSVFYTSWGYDQTNVEFFQVVRTTPSSVVLRAIQGTARDGRLHPVPDAWCTDTHLMGNSTEWNEAAQGWVPAKRYERDMARGYSEKICRRPKSNPGGYESASLRIDNVRYAFPYDGRDGVYETFAAGGTGH